MLPPVQVRRCEIGAMFLTCNSHNCFTYNRKLVLPRKAGILGETAVEILRAASAALRLMPCTSQYWATRGGTGIMRVALRNAKY